MTGAVRASLLLAAAPALYACRRDVQPAAGPQERARPATTSVKLDNFGYRPDDAKVAIFTVDPGPRVEARTAAGEVAFVVPVDGGSIRDKGEDAASGDHVWWVDLSPLEAPGRYRLFSTSVGAPSYEFEIAADVYGEVMRTALKTFYLQRCGTPKPASHAGPWADPTACHRGDASTAAAPGHRNEGRRDLTGGWHDAGDYNKYVWKAASDAILFLLHAWEDEPAAFRDGDLDIPESGNGWPDILDEVKWELDFLLKMQLPDGSVLSRVHSAVNAGGASPPSADRTPRYYEDPSLESGAVFAGSCALASRIFRTAGETAYAACLEHAALRAWDWLQGQGDSDAKVWAAAEVYRMNPATTSARRYVDAYHAARWAGSAVDLDATSYEAHAVLTYVEAAGATPAVASSLRATIGRQVDRIFSADDLYRSGLPLSSYHWGSNAVRAGRGVFLLQAARLGATGSHTGDQCRRHALDFLHFFHGQNPLSMVYLTNMADRGGEHSSWQLFHNWFGQSEDAYSRSHYLGKPASVAEPHYPYFDGEDNHGIRDDKASSLGPAPGFVPGGPNKDYSGDAVPPGRSARPGRFYRDWNDQAAWTARTWEITESSIAYQGPYVALAAAFATRNSAGAVLTPRKIGSYSELSRARTSRAPRPTMRASWGRP